MEIKIARTGRQCHASGRPFEHQEPIISLIRYVERDLHREDYARDAWKNAYGEGAVAVWEATYIDPAVENAEPEESFSPLRRLFYDHAARDDRESMAVCYLAAQLLRRQKVFRLVKESDNLDEGGKLTLFADRIGERLIEVRDPSLSFAELETGRGILVRYLQEAEEAALTEEVTPEVEEDQAGEEHDGTREETAHAQS